MPGDTIEGATHTLPFSTFASIAALGLEIHVYCARCHALRRIDPLAEAIRDRQFVGARFVCRRCGSLGMAQLQAPEPLIAGGPVTLQYLWCNACMWEAKALPVAAEPWKAMLQLGRPICSGCRKPVKGHIVLPMGPGGLSP